MRRRGARSEGPLAALAFCLARESVRSVVQIDRARDIK